MIDKSIVNLIKELFPKMTDKEKLAFCVAFGAHTAKDQRDYAGLEYIGHPLTVYQGCDTQDEKVVALLHDVVEDTEITLSDLSILFEPHIVEAVGLLSHPKVYDKEAYITNLKANPIARKVKIEDLKTNMDKSRLESLLQWHDNRVENQYKKNLEFLLSEDK